MQSTGVRCSSNLVLGCHFPFAGMTRKLTSMPRCRMTLWSLRRWEGLRCSTQKDPPCSKSGPRLGDHRAAILTEDSPSLSMESLPARMGYLPRHGHPKSDLNEVLFGRLWTCCTVQEAGQQGRKCRQHSGRALIRNSVWSGR